MQTTIRRLLSLWLVLCLLLCGCTPKDAFSEGVQAESALAKATGTSTGAILKNTEWFPAGSSAADWLALTLRLCGVREDYDSYLRDLEAFVLQKHAALSATDCARIALTVQTLGGDPASFGGVDLPAAGCARYEEGATLNAAVYLLMAMDACRYADEPMRETFLHAIVSAQTSDGGFGLFASGEGDTDVTAMALQALAAYRTQYADVIERALSFLASAVTAEGACTSMQSPNAESTAQVLLALCALEIDPQEDARFAALPDGLLRFRMDNGLYRHTKDAAQYDVLATQQSLLARLALHRLQNGEAWIYAS